jgi:hypothetical protein
MTIQRTYWKKDTNAAVMRADEKRIINNVLFIYFQDTINYEGARKRTKTP